MVCVLTIEDPPPKGRGREAGGGIWNHWTLRFQLPTKACSAINRQMTGWMNWPSGWMDDCTDLREASFGRLHSCFTICNNFHSNESNPVKMAQASFSGGELISWSPAYCGTHLVMSHLRGRSRGGVLVLSQQ
jgi:hypothetical protein